MRIFQGFAREEGDSEETTLMKSLVFFVSVSCSICGLLWSLLYYNVFGASFITMLPLLFVGIVGPAALVAHFLRKYRILIYAQILCIMCVTSVIQWSIGSIDQSGMVFAWSFLGPTAAVMFLNRSQAILFMALWFCLLIISMVFEPNFFGNAFDLPHGTKALFYVINLGAAFSVIFLTFLFLHTAKERMLALILKNRDLERTNYEQELLLRQNEKLATLGRLSAGVAHELNNPSAAVERGAARLQKAIPNLNKSQYELGIISLSENELEMAAKYINSYVDPSRTKEEMDPLVRSDLEREMEGSLEELNVENSWEIAPELVNIGLDKQDLKIGLEQFGPERMRSLLPVLYHLHITNDLLEEICEGTQRISEIIKALKAYTYMDQSPVQYINVNEGLDNTLIMLRSKLKHDVTVHKDFAKDLPEIMGYGSELNQVWTNLIDNAVDAMQGHGEIFLRTWRKKDSVFVEIQDTGRGIPEDVEQHIFDPFYTTKEQGKGTGLGLHISYNIIAAKHGGMITVKSKPGETVFRVELPIQQTNETSEVAS